MLINFYFRLRCYLLLGSSTLQGFGATHIFISRRLCYTMCLVHLRTLSSLFSFSFWLRLRLYIIFCFYLLLVLALQPSSYLIGCVFVYTTSAEQIASSCSSTCNTCNTAGCSSHDASRVDASLETGVSSSQAPPSIHSH